MLSLYRRHRPRSFDSVVGQEHIVRTLRNAIGLDKVHHAYLFVGSRGTGKTSMAKLLACALNAPGGPRAEFAPDEPGARAIMTGTSLDVIEMDAASNNSVDDIRELRENVALAPMGGGRRVYILDEAHMLSASAWNAFLKTLEEPPPHAVFVLATTEAHKVPATIIDRCHRFDFHRPSLEQIASVLGRVAEEEAIELPDAAVGMIARSATGSFRDALGTLEQLVTYGGNRVELDDVLEILGVADVGLVFDAAESLVDQDARAALLSVESLSASGRDVGQFMRDLTAHLRHLFVVQTLGQVPDSFSVTAEHTDRLAGQAARLDQGRVLRAIELLAAAMSAVKEGSDSRVQLEVALLKAVQPQSDLSLGALVYRIEQLERRLAAAEGPSGAARAPSASGNEHETVAPASAHSPRTSAAPVAAISGGATALATAPAPAPAQELELDGVRTLWPAALDGVRGENAMVGALLAEARPIALDGGSLKVAFPADCEFSKKKAEANRGLLQAALLQVTGHSLALEFELAEPGDETVPTPTLSHEQLLERLKEEFGATEVFEDASDQED